MNKEIVEARIRSGLSINDIAKTLDISESMVRKVESGKRMPSIKLAKRWAVLLRVPECEIVGYFFKSK